MFSGDGDGQKCYAVCSVSGVKRKMLRGKESSVLRSFAGSHWKSTLHSLQIHASLIADPRHLARRLIVVRVLTKQHKFVITSSTFPHFHHEDRKFPRISQYSSTPTSKLPKTQKYQHPFRCFYLPTRRSNSHVTEKRLGVPG